MKAHELCRDRISESCYKEVIKDFEDLTKPEGSDQLTDTWMAQYVKKCYDDSWEGEQSKGADNTILR